jgi:hypothetical protein
MDCDRRSGGANGEWSPGRSICVLERVEGKESRGKLGRHSAPVSLRGEWDYCFCNLASRKVLQSPWQRVYNPTVSWYVWRYSSHHVSSA